MGWFDPPTIADQARLDAYAARSKAAFWALVALAIVAGFGIAYLDDNTKVRLKGYPFFAIGFALGVGIAGTASAMKIAKVYRRLFDRTGTKSP
jgi:hypothetical protein